MKPRLVVALALLGLGGTLAYQQAGSLVDLQGAGLVIPIVDQRVPSNRSAVYVQVYPGGLVRATMAESYD